MKEVVRRRNPEAKRAALHDSAFELLSLHRYDDVSVTQIAENAGVAVGTFYRFYPTKMDMLEAMSDGLEKEFVAVMREAWDSQENYMDKFQAIAEFLFDLMDKFGSQIAVMEITAGHRSSKSKPMGDMVRAEIARLYKTGVKRGHFTPHNPDSFAAAAHGLVDGLMRKYLTNPSPDTRASNVALVTDMLQRLAARYP